jgi:hypothetical protein
MLFACSTPEASWPNARNMGRFIPHSCNGAAPAKYVQEYDQDKIPTQSIGQAASKVVQ